MGLKRLVTKLVKLPNNIAKKAINAVLPGTGRSAAKRAESQANDFAAQANAQASELNERTRKARVRAQQLQIRGLRSRRSASFYQAAPTGSDTIG